MKERPDIQRDIEPAIRNHELYWSKKPLNEIRRREGVPALHPTAFIEMREAERAKIAEIARKQQENW